MWASIISVVLMVVEWWLKKQKDNAAALAAFYKFVHSANVNYLDGVVAGRTWRRQAGELAAELDKRGAP